MTNTAMASPPVFHFSIDSIRSSARVCRQGKLYSRLEEWRSALDRQLLNDAQWERIAPLLPGKEGDPGRSGENNRLFVEAVLWMARAVARPAGVVRQVVLGVEALPPLGTQGRI